MTTSITFLVGGYPTNRYFRARDQVAAIWRIDMDKQHITKDFSRKFTRTIEMWENF